MTLEETAIAFCKECLGWDVPLGVTGYGWPDGPEVTTRPEDRDYPDEHLYLTLSFCDLCSMMKAVQEWQDQACLDTLALISTTISYSLGIFKAHVLVDGKVFTAKDGNPCPALLAACVAANRSMRGVS